MFFGRSKAFVKCVGRRADASSACMNLYAKTAGFCFDFLQVGITVVFVDVEVRKQNDIDLQRRRVVQQLRCLPAQGSNREVIEPQLDFVVLLSAGRHWQRPEASTLRKPLPRKPIAESFFGKHRIRVMT